MTDLTQYEMASYHVQAVEVKGEVVWYEPNKRFQWRKIPFSKDIPIPASASFSGAGKARSWGKRPP